CTDTLRDRERVRPGGLEDAKDGGRLAVVPGELRVGQRAQLDPCDVTEPDRGAVGVEPHDDVRELLWLEELSLRSHRIRELLTVRSGVAADASGRIDVVLRRD